MNRLPPCAHPRWSRRRLLKAGAASVLAAGWAGPRRSWAAGGAPGRSLRLLFYTDIHARVEWETPDGMARAAAAINEQKADLIITGGDLITDGFQSTAAAVAHRWDAYMAMHRAIEGEIHPAIGNHDLVAADPDDGSPPSEDPRAAFKHHMRLDRTYRSLDAAGYHLVFLDPIRVTRGGEYRFVGAVGEEQLAWLDRDLASVSAERPIILVTHIPLLTNYYLATRGGTAPPSPRGVVGNNREVLGRFANHNLILVLQGHLHVDEFMQWRKTAFITGGAVCGQWWRGAWHGTPEGFGVATLHPDRVDWRYVDYGWTARRPAGE